MKGRITIACIALLAAAPALAGDPIAQLSKQTGLSERQVSMIVGNRSTYVEYRTSYNRSLRKFKEGIGGQANFERLMSGQQITLPRKDEVPVQVAAL